MRRSLLLVLALLGGLLTACASGGSEPDEATPQSARPVVFVAAGDIACEPGQAAAGRHCRQAATAKLALNMHATRVIALGDTQYERGAYSSFLGSYDRSWGRLLDVTYPVVGNHEFRTRWASGYFRYFAGHTSKRPGYYWRSIGGWQLFFLNSNCDQVNCITQRAWLETKLKQHPGRCQLIAMHHPRYSSGSEHGSQPLMKGFWQIAVRHRVDVALAGHDHDYERFAPMDASGNVRSYGMTSYVSGAGGKSLYPKGRTAYGSRKFYNLAPGVLKLTLRPTSWSWEFRNIYGTLVDSGTRNCH